MVANSLMVFADLADIKVNATSLMSTMNAMNSMTVMI
jgi:hypothetical protein